MNFIVVASDQNTPEWRAAIRALMLVAEQGGPTMLARIGIWSGGRRRGLKPRSRGLTPGPHPKI
jgi:hypothetical protein